MTQSVYWQMTKLHYLSRCKVTKNSPPIYVSIFTAKQNNKISHKIQFSVKIGTEYINVNAITAVQENRRLRCDGKKRSFS
jgi:hypothetical protein